MLFKLQYLSHKILQSNSKIIINLLILSLIYVCFYSQNIVYAMNETTEHSYDEVLKLVEENKKLYKKLNVLTQTNADLIERLTATIREKSELIYRQQQSLYEAQMKEREYLDIIESYKSNQAYLLNSTQILNRELADTQTHLRQVINDNMDLRFQIEEQKEADQKAIESFLALDDKTSSSSQSKKRK